MPTRRPIETAFQIRKDDVGGTEFGLHERERHPWISGVHQIDVTSQNHLCRHATLLSLRRGSIACRRRRALASSTYVTPKAGPHFRIRSIQHERFGRRSTERGLSRSIRFSFQSRFHSFIFLSRRIAASAESCLSNQTSRSTP